MVYNPGMDWYEILLAVKRVAKDGEITSLALSEKIDVPNNVCSAWLGKFTRWGYLKRSGSVAGPKRWIRTYELTKWGFSFKRSSRRRRLVANPKKKKK